MTWRNIWAVACLYALTIACPAAAQPDGPDTIERFRTDVDSAIVDGLMPSAAFAIVDETGVRWAEAFGEADIENHIAATTGTIYTIGSISKTFIGTAAAIASQEGALDTSADIDAYLDFRVRNPAFPDLPITFWQLANHGSSIIDRDDAYETAYSFGDPVHPLSLQDYLRAYLVPGGELYNPDGNFLDSAPGTHYQYSNIASGLAARVVEGAVGQPFQDYSRDRIFEPLGMTSTSWFSPDLDQSQLIRKYRRTENGFEPYQPYALATWPDGGLNTTVLDLARYLAAIINHGELDGRRILSRENYARLVGPHGGEALNDLPRGHIHRGLFWGAREAPSLLQRRMLIGHDGADPGVTALMLFDPVTDRGAIVLTNADFDERDDLIALYRLYYRLFEMPLPE